MESFPIGVRVVTKDLKAEHYNGRTGIVRSGVLASGRQNVALLGGGQDDGGDKVMALKAGNLQLEPRAADVLSIKELKLILERKKQEQTTDSSAPSPPTVGMDKSDLQRSVSELSTPEENAQILAEAATAAAAAAATKASAPAPAAPTLSRSEIERQADVMSGMTPDQLRQQAAMMRSMDPASLRRMDPQLAGMSDAQIRFAADQLEMMAGNPAMMKQAADQVKHMAPEELERQRRAMMNSNGSSTMSASSARPPSTTTSTSSSAAAPDPRSVDTLSVKELKLILENKLGKSSCGSQLPGMDKSDLQQKVSELSTPEEIAQILLAKTSSIAASAPVTAPASAPTPNLTKDQLKQQADRMSEMSPEQLRQQASMMRSMDPASLRRMNPQLAGMNDAQIRFAADQLEMMAGNPSMMKMAAEQVKHMSPEELEQQRQAMMRMGDTPGSVSSSTSASPSSSAAAAGSGVSPSMGDPGQMLNSMSPEQIQQQAQMLKSMPPDQLRQMSPQFRGMSDAQIEAAAAQMEMMASNPGMMKAAAEQMKNMSPDDVRAMQEGRMPANMDMNQMMNPSNMDAKQLKNMLQTLKDKPELLKSMLGSRADGMSEEDLQKSFDAFANMDERQLERALSFMGGLQKAAQPFRAVYDKTNRVVGGHLLKILLVLAVVGVLASVYLVLGYLVFSRGSTSATVPLEHEPVVDAMPDVEFEDEF